MLKYIVLAVSLDSAFSEDIIRDSADPSASASASASASGSASASASASANVTNILISRTNVNVQKNLNILEFLLPIMAGITIIIIIATLIIFKKTKVDEPKEQINILDLNPTWIQKNPMHNAQLSV
jgi:hypothetical protein